MEWGLFVLAMLFIAVLQLAVWRRLQSGDVGVTDQASRHDNAHPRERQVREDTEPGVTLCPRCGTENETGFDFCRECVGSLQL